MSFEIMQTEKLTVSPRYSRYAYDLFPLSVEEYNSLKADIVGSEIHSPLSINKQGVILDGHHRYKIATELGIKDLPVSVMNFSDPLEELYFVVNINTLRRQLNDYQKALIGYELEKIESQKARQRQLSALKQNKDRDSKIVPSAPIGTNDNNVESGKSAQIVAQKIGISTRTFQRAKNIIEKGDSEMKEAVRSNKMSISRAESIIKHKENKKQRIDALMKKAASYDHNSFDDNRYKLFPGDFREQQQNIADSSIDLIFTDPQYTRESLPLYKDLGVMAYRVLKEGGSLLCYAGHYALLEIGKMMESSGLTYWWLIVVDHSGHSNRMHKQRVWAYYKPLLWFVKGDRNDAPEDIGDLIKSESVDKLLHKWQQSTVEAQYCIKHLTVEGQTVLDPFLGSGTTALAALKLNRRFIGIEKDIDVMDVARANIASFEADGSTPVTTLTTTAVDDSSGMISASSGW